MAPASPREAHRPVRHTPPAVARIISKPLSVHFQNRLYQLQGQGRGDRLRGTPGTVWEAFDGSGELLGAGRALPDRLLTEGPTPIPGETEKPLALRLATIRQAPRRLPRDPPAPDQPGRLPLRPPLAPPPAS